MLKLSVIIPSYKDPYLHHTIESILLNSELGNELEIVVVLDGYWPETPITNDPRVKIIHLGKNRGMRGAINVGVAVSKGEYIMRTDEHCAYAKGFDKVLIDSMQDNYIMTATRYFLDPTTWTLMDIKPVIYEKLKIRDMGDGAYKFEGVAWGERTRERTQYSVDETMAMQGSMWLMKRSWWDSVIKELDSERYGDMLQDSHEMQFKTWKAGGKLMVNKDTWFAHKHVSFPRTHNHPRENYEQGIRNMYEDWKDYYREEVAPKWNL